MLNSQSTSSVLTCIVDLYIIETAYTVVRGLYSIQGGLYSSQGDLYSSQGGGLYSIQGVCVFVEWFSADIVRAICTQGLDFHHIYDRLTFCALIIRMKVLHSSMMIR